MRLRTEGRHADRYIPGDINLLLQNRGSLGAESLYKSSVTGGLPKLLK